MGLGFNIHALFFVVMNDDVTHILLYTFNNALRQTPRFSIILA
jgi:hypothetical protein